MPRTDEDWKDYVAKELRSGESRMNGFTEDISTIKAEQSEMRKELAANSEATARVEANTAEMLDVFESWKGAMRVLESVGKLAKPLGYIIGLGAAIAGLWTAIKTGIQPK